MILLMALLSMANEPGASRFDVAEFDYHRPGAELCLPSGLRITLVYDERQPVVSVSTVIDRGANQDPVGREGSAHLLEHVWFHAQTPSGTIQERLADLGATYNAVTLGDATVYMTMADHSVLADLLAIEALRLADPLRGVSPAVIEQERAIVTSETTLRGVVPTDYARLLPQGFGGNPLGLLPRSNEALTVITTDDLQTVATSYAPSTTTILISGPVDSTDVQRLVEQAFSEQPRTGRGGECGRRPVVEEVSRPSLAPRGALHTTVRSVDDPTLLVGWSLPPAFGRDETLMRILSEQVRQRLRDSVAGSRFLDAKTGCEFVPSPVASSLICAATVPDGVNGGAVLTRMTELGSSIDTLEEWVDIGLSRREGIADIIVGLDAASPLYSDEALRDVLTNHYAGSHVWFEDALGAFGTVESSEVNRFLRTWMRPEVAWFSMVVPPGTDIERVLAGRAQARAAETVVPPTERPMRAREEPRDVHRGPPLGELRDRHTEPSSPSLAQPVVRTLETGMKVVVLQHGVAPVSHTALVVDGAAMRERRLGVDQWAWELTGINPQAFTNGEPFVEASLLASHLWFDDLGSARVVGTSGSTSTLDGQLGLLADFASTTGRIGDTARQDLRAAIRRRARRVKKDPSVVQEHAQWTHLLGGQSPFVYPKILLIDHGAHAGLAAVDKHIRTLWHPSNATLYVVSEQHPEDVLEAVQAQFGDWKERRLRTSDVSVASAPLPTERAAFETVEPEETSAVLRVTCRADDGTPDAVTEVVAELWREWAHRTLRESDIAAYNPSVSTWKVGEQTVLGMSVTVAPEQGLPTARRMDAGLTWLASGVTDAEVQRASGRLRAAWAQRFVQSSDVLTHLVTHQADIESYAATGSQQLMRTTASDVHDVGRACSMNATLGVVTPQAGVVSESPWGGVLQEAELAKGK